MIKEDIHRETETLIEFYDPDEMMLNLIGAVALHPRRVIYFYYGLIDSDIQRRNLKRFLSGFGEDADVQMIQIRPDSPDALMDWIKQHRSELGVFAFDLSGGDDLMLFMAGRCRERYGCRVFGRNFTKNKYVDPETGETYAINVRDVTVEERLLIHDGHLLRYGRLKPGDLTDDRLEKADAVLCLQKNEFRKWNQQVLALQKGNDKNSTVIKISTGVCREFGFTTFRGHFFRELREVGVISSFSCNENELQLRFDDEVLRYCLQNMGIWLEMSVYHAMRQCGQFDDVRMSCVVGWGENETMNELDVLAVAGLEIVFVSCKTGTPDMKTISELNVLRRRFGTCYSRAVLVVLTGSDSDVSLDGVKDRCGDFDIELLDLRSLSSEQVSAYFSALGKRMRMKI